VLKIKLRVVPLLVAGATGGNSRKAGPPSNDPKDGPLAFGIFYIRSAYVSHDKPEACGNGFELDIALSVAIALNFTGVQRSSGLVDLGAPLMTPKPHDSGSCRQGRIASDLLVHCKGDKASRPKPN